MVSTHFHFNGFFPNMLCFFLVFFVGSACISQHLLQSLFLINPEQNAERRIDNGAVGVICLPMIAAFRHIFSVGGKYTRRFVLRLIVAFVTHFFICIVNQGLTIQHCLCYSFRDEWFILLYVLYCGLTVPQNFPFITSVFITYGNISIVNLQKHQTYVCEMIKSKLIKNIKIKAVADLCGILFVDTMNSIRKTINPINFFIANCNSKLKQN